MSKPGPKPAGPQKVHIADTPLTRQNWYKHVNWLNVAFIIGIPVYGCIQALWVPLQLKTAIWAVIYYFFTGLGITAGMCACILSACCLVSHSDCCRLPSSLGSLLLFCSSPAAYVAGRCWWWRRRGLRPLVGS